MSDAESQDTDARKVVPGLFIDISHEERTAFQLLISMSENQRAFVLAWFCHCGRYLPPAEPVCARCRDE